MRSRFLSLGFAVGFVAAFALGLLPRSAAAAEKTVFDAKTQEGEVWVSVQLTRFRLDEEYIPIAVVVRNNFGKAATLDRTSFRLVGADGRVESLPDVATLRDSYKKDAFDRTALRLYGIPFGTRLDLERMEPSEYFPVLLPGSGVVIDHVTLAPLWWTVDLLYFKRPAGLAEGRNVTLKVQPKGWEMPVSVTFSIQ